MTSGDPDYNARAADIANQLEAIADMLAASAGTGDGVIPPPGSPGDIDFERALDEAFPHTRRRTDEEVQAAMDFADGVLGAAGRELDPSVRPIVRDYTAGRITHAEYMRRAGLVPPDEVERQRRERVARDFKQGKIDEAEFLLRFLYGDDGD